MANRLGLEQEEAGPCQRPAVQPLRFSKPGATNEQFLTDRYQCIQEARTRVSAASYGTYGGGAASNVYVDRGTMLSCMAARGYIAGLDGQFSAPPGGVIVMIN